MLPAYSKPIPAPSPAFPGLQPPVPTAVVLAVKNEAQTIGQQVRKLLAEGTVAIVVDNASTDGTSQAAAGAGAWVVQAGKELSFRAAILQGVRLAASMGSQVLITRA